MLITQNPKRESSRGRGTSPPAQPGSKAPQQTCTQNENDESQQTAQENTTEMQIYSQPVSSLDREMALSVRTAITAPQSRLGSHSVPDNINKCFLCQGIFDPLKHTHTKTNTLILDRYTLISYICSRLTADPSGAKRCLRMCPCDGVSELFPWRRLIGSPKSALNSSEREVCTIWHEFHIHVCHFSLLFLFFFLSVCISARSALT